LPAEGCEGRGVQDACVTSDDRRLGGDDQRAATAQAFISSPGSLPATARLMLAPQDDPAKAEAAARELAHAHYENFSVVSLLLPKHLRQDFCNVYAFCRVADDLGDEAGDREQSLRLLAELRSMTEACYAGRASTALFVALAGTIRRYDIPIQPLLDLIDAFEQDQRVLRYETFEQLVDYCRRSADPVGRLVLYMCGYRDPMRQRLSDRICTALQLTNFWQDVRRDIVDRNRIYLPRESMQRFGVTEAQIVAGTSDEHFREAMKFEVDRTAAWFDEGEPLLAMLHRSVRPQISLFAQGGRAILAAIRRQGYDTLTSRPALGKWKKGSLVLKTLAATVGSRWGWYCGRGGEVAQP
jgi:squalene synthase HpnC